MSRAAISLRASLRRALGAFQPSDRLVIGPTAEAFKPSDRPAIGPTAEAFKASNVARAALRSCGPYADSLAGVMGNEVAAHRKLLSLRMWASVDRDKLNRYGPASWSLPRR